MKCRALSMRSEGNSPSLFHLYRNALLKLQLAHASSLALAEGVQVERIVRNALEMRLRRLIFCAFAEWFCHRLAAASRSTKALAFALFFSANGFECAVLCWAVSDERGEVHLAGD